ncbi:TRAP transporter substrate-binding protein DctP [Deferribacteraceae bacterium V6Fe1]|nr:TRAP transporter substrate-binding protein DctP [Deferribacteraceae bacterium V6Fe1]
MKRRDFLKKAAATTAVAGASLAFGAPAVHAAKKYQWKMATTWPPNFPVFGESANFIAKWIEEMSEGRLKIHVYAGGELVPALQAFDAVGQGMVEMGHGCAYYWAGKAPAAQFFGAVPFGLNSQQMNSWITAGDGMKLWEELYANFNLKPFLVGECGVQMGGWFNKEINTIADVKGLKMRIPGLGGKVISKAGGSAVLSAGGEIYTNLERGVIDATEWVGPYHDYKMGFYKVAKFYYYPGWHEPGTAIEMFVNKKAYESLPKDLQQIVAAAAAKSNEWMLAEFEAQNNFYLNKLLTEHNVKLKKFPKEVLLKFKEYTKEVLDDVTSKDPMSKKVYENYSKFQKMIMDWDKLSEVAYSEIMY